VVEIPDSAAFDSAKEMIRRHDLWIDAILGTGLRETVRGHFREAIDFINSRGAPIVAVDVPSGLNADTGQPCGSCIRAFATATFGFAKTGHYQDPGCELSGRLRVVDIGIPAHVAEEVAPRQFLLTDRDMHAYLKPRAPATHKGRTGHLLVVAGSPGKSGAAGMTARAAMRAGAGLVTLAGPRGIGPILATGTQEVMTAFLPETEDGRLGASAAEPIRELLQGKTCMAVGPGMGQAGDAAALLRQLVLECRQPLVIDADGLNNLAGATAVFRQHAAPVVLTPHPGEMARLAETSVAAVQSDRIACAREFARSFKVHLVLKGSHTVVAHPDGFVFINPTGNAGMAAGGMGDVLTGLIAGFITQGFPVEAACHLGVFLHGAAADRQKLTKGPWGYLASEVIDGLPSEIGRYLGH
jgi:NAD(P)H-hydrate epimerase